MSLTNRDDSWMLGDIPPGFGKIFREEPLNLPEYKQPVREKTPEERRRELLAGLNLVTSAMLSKTKFKEPTWAIEGLVPEGLSLLAGKPKTGKSWMGLDFAISVAAGSNALGNIPCKQGAVLYLALEDTKRRLANRQAAVLQGAQGPEGLTIATEWKRGDEGGLEAIEAWILESQNPRLVIIDTLQKVRGTRKRDAGVYEDDCQFVAKFKTMADKHTVPFIMIHHLNKAAVGDDPLMAVSGTAGVTGTADTTLVLEREANNPNAVLYVRGRDVAEAELAIQFDGQTGKWLRLGNADDWRISEERRSIIRLLVDEGGAMFPKDIAAALGKKAPNIRFLLHKMHKEGEIVKLSDGRYSP